MNDPRETLNHIRKQADAAANEPGAPRFLDALEAVLKVHKCLTFPDDGWGEPTACSHCDNEPWPCRTVRAITTALEATK